MEIKLSEYGGNGGGGYVSRCYIFGHVLPLIKWLVDMEWRVKEEFLYLQSLIQSVLSFCLILNTRITREYQRIPENTLEQQDIARVEIA